MTNIKQLAFSFRKFEFLGARLVVRGFVRVYHGNCSVAANRRVRYH